MRSPLLEVKVANLTSCSKLLLPHPSPPLIKMLLANSENLTPQPPSLAGKGELDSPPLRGEGLGEGSDPSVIDQQYLIKGRELTPPRHRGVGGVVQDLSNDTFPTLS